MLLLIALEADKCDIDDVFISLMGTYWVAPNFFCEPLEEMDPCFLSSSFSFWESFDPFSAEAALCLSI